MRSVLVALLGLFTCGQPGFLPEGAWQSDRDLTLAEFRQARSFTPEQWRLLSSPEFFGHLVYVLHGGTVVTVYDGECSAPMSYSLDAPSRQVRFSGPEVLVVATLEGDQMHVPIPRIPGRLRETFSRVDLDAVVRRHPCLLELVNEP
jgi:hypothetical protein